MMPNRLTIVPSIKMPTAPCNRCRVRAASPIRPHTRLDKGLRRGFNVRPASLKPLFGLLERQPHQQRLPLLARARLPGPIVLLAPRFKLAAPDEEFVLDQQT